MSPTLFHPFCPVSPGMCGCHVAVRTLIPFSWAFSPPPPPPPPPLQGYQQFTSAIRRVFSLPRDSELNITFTCDEPLTGEEECLGGGGAGAVGQVRCGKPLTGDWHGPTSGWERTDTPCYRQGPGLVPEGEREGGSDS